MYHTIGLSLNFWPLLKTIAILIRKCLLLPNLGLKLSKRYNLKFIKLEIASILGKIYSYVPQGLSRCIGRPRGGGRSSSSSSSELEKLVHELVTTMEVNSLGGNYAVFMGWVWDGLMHNVVCLTLPLHPVYYRLVYHRLVLCPACADRSRPF